MKKVCFVNFGHTDMALGLAKNIATTEYPISLYFCFSLNSKAESVIDFTEKTVGTGFMTKGKIDEILQVEIREYLKDIKKLNFFIFYNLKLRSIRNFFLSFKLARELRRYEIIHFNGSSGMLPFLIFLLRKKKMIFTIHDVHSHSGEGTRLNFSERLNNYIIQSAYPIVVQNKMDHKALIDKYPELKNKIKFIPFGELDIYRTFASGKADVPGSDFLFFGRISPYKGLIFLVEAFTKISLSFPNAKLVIAGAGDVGKEREIISSNKNITLINSRITNEQMAGLIMNTSVVVCPYTDATQSGVAMTAFAFNKPVIATEVGGFVDVIENGKTGFLVPTKNTTQLEEAMRALLKNEGLRSEFSTNIEKAKASSSFGWSNIAREHIELYNSIA